VGASPPKKIFQLKITLQDIEPPIWRRFQVDGKISLATLHKIIQTVMGWHDSHLHVFQINDQSYGPPDPYDESDALDERRVKLSQVSPDEKSEILYEYDFGDGWVHQLVVEKISPPELGVRYPICLDGQRNCPPEDSGGPYEYSNLVEAIQEPDHPEHQDVMDWLDGMEFDPEFFDHDEISQLLHSK
jgi:hypothetical protein